MQRPISKRFLILAASKKLRTNLQKHAATRSNRLTLRLQVIMRKIVFQVGGSRPRLGIQSVEKEIGRLKHERPALFSWEIREKLIERGYCTRTNAPSVSSINRLLRSKGLGATKELSEVASELKANVRTRSVSNYSIESILGLDSGQISCFPSHTQIP